MTDEQRAKRIHHHMYETCEGIAEHAERIVRLEEENAKLRELALKNWYIALSEREALSAHDIDPDGGTYIAALDDEIATAKDRMRELGIEVE